MAKGETRLVTGMVGLLLGAGLLLAILNEWPAPVRHSWPLFAAIPGVMCYAASFRHYFALGTIICGNAAYWYLILDGKLEWGKTWPGLIILVVVAVIFQRVVLKVSSGRQV